jgi:hypothetical protein
MTPSPPYRAQVRLPLLPLGVPDAFRKQAVDIGQQAVAVDEEPESLAVRLARPPARPRFAARVSGVEADTAKRLCAAMWTAFNVAPCGVLLADPCAAVGAGVIFHLQLRSFVNRPKSTGRTKSKSRSNSLLKAVFVDHVDRRLCETVQTIQIVVM